MWAHGYSGFHGGFPIFPIFPILFFLIIVVGGFFFFRASAHRYGGGRGPWARFDQAESVLRERYARGEIDAEEYQTRKDELKR